MFRKLFGRKPRERQSLEERVAMSDHEFTRDVKSVMDESSARYLGLTLGEYRKIKTRYEELLHKKYPAIKHHFQLHQRIKSAYVSKDSATWKITKQRCIDQINFSGRAAAAMIEEENDLAEISRYSKKSKPHKPRPLPRHEGYERMCIILDKEGDYEGVIEFAELAKSDGWNGAWDRRIERARKRLDRN